MTKIELVVNGRSVRREVDDAMLLSTLLREELGLTGTHIGCDTSQCGACVVSVNGDTVKSCTMLAAQVDSCEVRTIEALSAGGQLHPMQQAFSECHGLQCGYCTPGLVMTAIDIAEKSEDSLDEATIRWQLKGNLCRCTGYQNIVDAILLGAERMGKTVVRA